MAPLTAPQLTVTWPMPPTAPEIVGAADRVHPVTTPLAGPSPTLSTAVTMNAYCAALDNPVTAFGELTPLILVPVEVLVVVPAW